ncbi:sensor histidine kinase [Allokutzneria sp. A3M-2-11 16]|uniref:sensor histidine kinase n=1 Tax=Allokutzneria sp. A3M-2-11 16 TaxID=2962043 RepID=UPI0020B8536A|nr:sensor histidine kinase [Allokutzneria sp. A3M-2-11 16]MCP3801512.1 sensor histidine kinase [Allokutzneria sp. A3M-2-11 16]
MSSPDDAWQNSAGGWHLGFAALGLLTVTAAFPLSQPANQIMAIFLLIALGVWYAVTGAEMIGVEPGRLGYVYLAGAVPLTLAILWFTPAGVLVLFVLYPHVWMMLPTRWAAATTVTTVCAVGAIMVIREGFSPASVLLVAGITAVCLLLGLGLGLWITRIIRQSAGRAATLAELEATRAELAEVSHDAGVLAERERLAREIHDTLAQGFTSMVMMLQALEPEIDDDRDAAQRRRAQLEEIARGNLAEARSLVALLTPTHLEAAPLAEAVERLVAQVGRELGITATMLLSGEQRPLPTNHEVVLLRGTQEALANVRKHSGASSVSVELSYEEDRVTLEVCDNGKGFDGTTQDGFGLAGMRARVTQVGGTMQLAAPSGGGASLLVDLPIGGVA